MDLEIVLFANLLHGICYIDLFCIIPLLFLRRFFEVSVADPISTMQYFHTML